jgi:beta-mannosidase
MHHRTVNLAGDDWRLGQAPPGSVPDRATWNELQAVCEWLPATVPGNVRADLLRAGRLPDLALGLGPEAAQWVDDHCWWLVREFSHTPAPTERVHLVLRGVDYVSDLFLNGCHLGRHEGMFSPQVRDVTGLLRAENRLAVRLTGSRWLPRDRSTLFEKVLNQIEAKASSMPDRFPHRRDTLKCQMAFGWDFAPPLRTMGIWDDVYAVVSGAAFIQEVAAAPRLAGDEAVLTVRAKVDASQAGQGLVRCILTGETFECEPVVVEQAVELLPGPSHHTVTLALSQPRLWWPWDHGRPDLYRLTTEIWDGDELLDSLTQTVGLREVALDGWTLRVNGQRVYARGANWVPADLLPGRVGDADYRALLKLARQANMNLLRVWGGGLREKRSFYDLCDRLGILLWQEFPLACTVLTRYPRSPDYVQLVGAEAQAIVRDLRNHPSVALWCGGNEFDPERNRPLVAVLQQVVAQEDPTRPFLPASPAQGDSHNWQVWHYFQPPSAYRDDEAAFASEFGLQAPPSATALRRFIPPEELWPPGPSWAYHGAGPQKLRRYARPFLAGQEPTLERFVQASQRAQAHGLQIAIEHYRRRKANGCGGVLVWQLNEPWPAISWALLDYYRQPKLAYETVRRLFHPLLLSAEYPLQRFQPGDRFHSRIWIVNDRAWALPGCHLEVVLWDGSGQPVKRFARALDVAADSAGIVGDLDCELPAGGGWRLICQLANQDQTLATNEYDLSAHDGIQPTLGQRLWAWLVSLVTPA